MCPRKRLDITVRQSLLTASIYVESKFACQEDLQRPQDENDLVSFQSNSIWPGSSHPRLSIFTHRLPPTPPADVNSENSHFQLRQSHIDQLDTLLTQNHEMNFVNARSENEILDGNTMSQFEHYSPKSNFVIPSSNSSRTSSPDPEDSDLGWPWKRRKLLASSRTTENKATRESLSRTKQKSNFPCSFVGCREAFSRKHDRMRHEVVQHSRQCEWSCDKCRKFFSTEKTLAKHKCSRLCDSRWLIP